MAKDGYEDWCRIQADNVANEKATLIPTSRPKPGANLRREHLSPDEANANEAMNEANPSGSRWATCGKTAIGRTPHGPK